MDFLESVDAVYIATPHNSHYDYAKKAIVTGKHVLVETPMVLLGFQTKSYLKWQKKEGLFLWRQIKLHIVLLLIILL